MDFFHYIANFLNENPGKTVGALVGFLFGILILTYGFGKTLIILMFIILGVLIGKILDDKISVVDEIKNIFKRK